MDAVFLSRLQFAVTVFFHFVFVPLTLGLSMLLAIMETKYVRTGDETYKRMVKFWGKLFLINFVLGVVTGITLEFQFGTNWSRYSSFVGDIFGSLLAIEATVAFFLESTFVAVWAFGWDRVGKKVHCAAIWLVTIASNLSAVWIILANGFMQNPVGYVLRGGRAELENFLAVIANGYAWGEFFHNFAACMMLGGFFVLGISAWHLLRGSEEDLFRKSVRIAAPFALVFALLTALAGHQQGQVVAQCQPAKLAAMESHWQTEAPAPMYALVWPDQENGKNSVQAIKIPGLLTFMAHNDFSTEVKGLSDFPKEDIPPVLPSFLSFRLMVGLGGLFILLAFAAFLKRKDLASAPFFARLLTWCIPLPYIAIFAGWMLAEVGRQPWIVYGLMRTADGVSPVLPQNIAVSLAAFIVIYGVLGLIDIALLIKYARKGPEAVKEEE